MAFPSNPSIGDTFTLGGKTYRWNGTSWARVALSVSGLLSSAAILDNSISAAKLTPNVLTPYALDTDLTTANVVEVGNLYFTNARSFANVVNLLNAKANTSDLVTSNVIEGANLYFTNARTVAALTGGSGISIASNGMVTAFGAAVGNVSSVNGLEGAVVLSTANIVETGSLYFTNARVYSNVINIGYASNTYVNDRLLTKANVTDLTTSNVAETGGRNFFTNTRAISALTGGSGISIAANGRITASMGAAAVSSVNGLTGDVTISTANIAESGNLYYSNTRVQNYLTDIIGNVIPSTDSIYNLGSFGKRWKDIFLSGNSIYLGDAVIQANGNAIIIPAGSTIANQTTDNIAEGSNIYFTNNRVYSNVVLLDYSTNTYVNTRLNTKANTTDLTTANVSEVNNLYFTNARTYSNVILLDYANTSYVTAAVAEVVGGAPAALDALYKIAEAIGNDNTFVTTVFNELALKANTTDLTTANVSEVSNLYFTNARVYSNVISIGYAPNVYVNSRLLTKANVADLTTTNVTEGANLYFTNARVRTAISEGTGVNVNAITGVISIGQNVSTHSDVIFSNVTVTGNLNVQGNAVVFESNTLIIVDPLIQVGKNPTGDAVDLGFFAHYIGGSPSIERHAGLFRDASDGQFKLFTNLDPEPATIVDTANASYTAANLVVNYVVGKVTDISNHTTSSLTEGSNLYFTNARVYANVIAQDYSTNTYVNDRLGTKANVADLTTSNIIEGANLYFTNTRAISSLTAGSGLSIAANGLITSTVSGGGSGTVTDVFGQTVSVSNAQLACAVITSGVLNTTNVIEGANLYFTNTRSVSSLTGGTGISIAANGLVTSTISGTITSVFGQTTTVSNAQLACATITSGVLNTGNVIEGANLYFTNTRAVGALTSGSGISIAANGLITSTASGGGGSGTVTDVFGQTVSVSNAQLACAVITSGVLNTANVIEGANLYFTNTRSIYALTSGSGISIAANGLITSTAAGGGGSVTVSNDEATNAARFIVFEDVNTGTVSTISVSSSKLQFNPSTGTLTSNIFSGNGAPLTSLNAVNIAHGTLGVARGGTGTSSTPTNGQLLIGNGTNYTLAGITGTSNQITVTNGSGSITLSGPQDLGTGSSVQHGSFGVGTAASGTSGEIRATNNITAYYSDRRLKKNIKRIENALDKISRINGVSFQSNEVAQRYGYTDNKVQIGVIAQEIEKVLPEVVVPAPFDIGKNDEGEYSISGEHYKTVHYDKIVPLLIEAIKELKEEFEAFKRKVL